LGPSTTFFLSVFLFSFFLPSVAFFSSSSFLRFSSITASSSADLGVFNLVNNLAFEIGS
jgi:hypothetical protein